MRRITDNKIILVTRPTRLGELVARFNTVAQARFYIEHAGADFSDYQLEDATYRAALRQTQSILGNLGRLQVIDRSFLPNFVFAPDDTIVTLGQDGLVANTMKYLSSQPIIAVNPDAARWDGRLLPFQTQDLGRVVPEVFAHRRPLQFVTMAQVLLNDGQTLYAVNDLFIGPKSHISARYTIRVGTRTENQSSSGIVVSTGLGSSGWLKSLITGALAVSQCTAGQTEVVQAAPRPTVAARRKTEFAWDANYLCYTVREPFPTRTTGTSIVFGHVTAETPLILESRMAENGVIFSDGIERDFLNFNSGASAVVTVAERKGVLVK